MRRRIASAVVVAAVAAVAVAAVVDAVRPESPKPLDRQAVRRLRELDVTGTLIYTDPECELHAVSLPGLERAPLPDGPAVGCEISVSPDGTHVAPGGARWSPDGSRYAICRGTRVDVVPAAGGSPVQAYDGCAPAWRPDGMLLFARNGAIRQARSERIVVPRSELVRAALRHPNAPSRGSVDELRILDLAWSARRPRVGAVVALIEARYALGIPDLQTTVAGFEAGRLASWNGYFRRYDRLAVFPGDEVVPEPVDPAPYIQNYRITPVGPVDWSPDGRLLAVATRASVFVVDPAAQRRVRIPLTARDLAWR